MTKQHKITVPIVRSPNSVRHEIDALIRGISELAKQKPEKVATVLELWTKTPRPSLEKSSSKKAA